MIIPTTTELPHTTPLRRPWRNALYYFGFWLILTLWLRMAIPETLMGWERHQLFRFSAEYLTFFAIKSYPILQYIQAFFTQFYLYPLLGAAVMAGLLTLGVGAWHRLTGRFWTGLVWVAFMLPSLPYFNLLWVLVWLVMLGGGLLVGLRRLTITGRWVLTAGLAFAAAFILQENVALAVAFWAVLCGLRTRTWRGVLYGLLAGLGGAAVGLGLIALCGYPLYYTQDLLAWPLLTAQFHITHTFPTLFLNCPLYLRLWLPVNALILLALPLVALIHTSAEAVYHIRRWAISKRVLGLISGSLALFFLFAAGTYLSLRYQMEDFYLVERLAAERRWDEATEAAELAFFQHARPEAAGRNRALFLRGQRQRARTLAGRLGIRPALYQNDAEETYMADMLKISLLASRQATNRLFAYNGSYYFPLLFPEEVLHSPCSYLVALYYTQNGLYAEALHLLYDFVTCQRVNTAVLEPLLWNSVVVGDYEPCRKFIRLFEQSLFHRDIARRYTAYIADTAQTARRPEIVEARQKLSTRNHTVLAYQPDDGIIRSRLPYEGDNAAVYEYALALCLVYKDHPSILAEWPQIGRYYHRPPIHLQEAVLANFLPEQLDEAPSGIHPGIKARYRAFLQAYGLYLDGYLSFQKLQKNFEDTYWYHAMFNEIRPVDEALAETASNQI